MLTDTVKFSALGVNRAHLQDVVQADFALALETQYKDLERDALAALGALNGGHVERAQEILRIALHGEDGWKGGEKPDGGAGAVSGHDSPRANQEGVGREMTPTPGSIWKHDKGTFYKVLAVGRMEADPEMEVVIYQALEPSFVVWVRPLKEWVGFMPNERPRFTLVPGAIL